MRILREKRETKKTYTPTFRFCAADAVAIAGVILLAGLSALYVYRTFLFGSPSQSLEVVFTIDGETVYSVPLQSDEVQTFTTTGDLGSITVTVRDGEAAITAADCPDQICVRTGRISTVGQAVVCLPNHAVLRIEPADGSETSSAYDIMAN